MRTFGDGSLGGENLLNGKAYFHKYKSKATITISTSVWQDSAWPFEDDEDLIASIDGDKIVVSKRVKGQKTLEET